MTHAPALPLFSTLAAYNAWMNSRIYEGCARIPDAERKRDRNAFFRSIHGTLNHLLLADRIWMARFRGEPAPEFLRLDDELYSDFDRLRRERESTDEQILAWVSALDWPRLAGDLKFFSVVNPSPRVTPLWRALLHFFNHQTHHRGQVTTLMTQCGQDPGVTDLLWMPARS